MRGAHGGIERWCVRGGVERWCVRGTYGGRGQCHTFSGRMGVQKAVLLKT